MYDRILVPIALDHLSTADASLAVARKLLNTGGEMVLFNVVEDIPSYIETYLPDGTIDKNIADAKAELQKLAAGQENVSVNAKIGHGKPSTAIVDCAETIDADCIIVASHKPGLEDYLIGSTAARVVRHARCCVHVLR